MWNVDRICKSARALVGSWRHGGLGRGICEDGGGGGCRRNSRKISEDPAVRGQCGFVIELQIPC